MNILNPNPNLNLNLNPTLNPNLSPSSISSQHKTLTRRTFLQTTLSLTLGGTAISSLAAAAPVKMRLATLAPIGTSSDRALREMAQKWRGAPGGGVALTIFNGAGMGGETDIIRRMRIGQLQAAALTAGGLARIEPGVGCLQNMPLAFRSLDELGFVRTKLFPTLQKRMLEKDFHLLFLTDAGWVRMFSKTPAVVPEDFKPLKMFAEAENKEYIEIMRAMGFRPVPLEYGDILTGLTAGNMIESLACAPFYAEAGQFYTAAKHMLEINWVPLSGGTVIHRKTWESFSSEKKAFLLKVTDETAEQIQRSNREESEKAVAAMRKRGLTVHAVPAGTEGKWEEFARQIHQLVRGRLVPAELFDTVQSLLAEYRASKEKEKKA